MLQRKDCARKLPKHMRATVFLWNVKAAAINHKREVSNIPYLLAHEDKSHLYLARQLYSDLITLCSQTVLEDR